MSDQTKKKAIIVDIDGTLSNDLWRRHTYKHAQRDWNEINAMCKYDMPNPWCQAIVENFSAMGYHIIFLTARNSNSRELTEQWLMLNINPKVDYTLIMRPELDLRDDWMVKETVYRNEIEPFYDVLFCVEDKQSVTDMWRRIGMTCLQCDGDIW